MRTSSYQRAPQSGSRNSNISSPAVDAIMDTLGQLAHMDTVCSWVHASPEPTHYTGPTHTTPPACCSSCEAVVVAACGTVLHLAPTTPTGTCTCKRKHTYDIWGVGFHPLSPTLVHRACPWPRVPLPPPLHMGKGAGYEGYCPHKPCQSHQSSGAWGRPHTITTHNPHRSHQSYQSCQSYQSYQSCQTHS